MGAATRVTINTYRVLVIAHVSRIVGRTKYLLRLANGSRCDGSFLKWRQLRLLLHFLVHVHFLVRVHVSFERSDAPHLATHMQLEALEQDEQHNQQARQIVATAPGVAAAAATAPVAPITPVAPVIRLQAALTSQHIDGCPCSGSQVALISSSSVLPLWVFGLALERTLKFQLKRSLDALPAFIEDFLLPPSVII